MSKAKRTENEINIEDAAFRSRLGRALQTARRKLDMTPEELAKFSGIESVTAKRVRLIDTKTAIDINFREALRLSDVRGVSLHTVMADWGKRTGLLIFSRRA